MQPVYPKIFSAFFQCLCPKCRQGKVFKFPLKKIAKFSATNEFCPQCGLRFEAEPGFFWGSMYVSYAFSTGLMILTGIVFISNNWSLNYLWIVAPLIAIAVLPFGYRYSRMVMLYFISPKSHNFAPSKFIKNN